MITNMPKLVEVLPGVRKAAILMLSLGEEVSGEVLREFDEDEVQRLGHEIAKLGAVE